MKALAVIQHTSAEYLGLMEDHLEGRRIRFKYFRPFTEAGQPPQSNELADGLVLLGGGPWGSAGGRDVPSLDQEIALTRSALSRDLPVIGVGLGAQILAIAAGGGSSPAALEFRTEFASRVKDDALAGYLPERYPLVTYMRDRPEPPDSAEVLSVDESGRPALFQVGAKAFGFTGHPGFKPAMAEDLVMEFEESPDNPGPVFDQVRWQVSEIEESLIWIMTGLIQVTELMQPGRTIPLRVTT